MAPNTGWKSSILHCEINMHREINRQSRQDATEQRLSSFWVEKLVVHFRCHMVSCSSAHGFRSIPSERLEGGRQRQVLLPYHSKGPGLQVMLDHGGTQHALGVPPSLRNTLKRRTNRPCNWQDRGLPQKDKTFEKLNSHQKYSILNIRN